MNFIRARKNSRKYRGVIADSCKMCLIAASLGLMDMATAQTEVHKCTDADGGIVYSQLPCVPHTPEKNEKPEPASAKPDSAEADREACKKRYRNAIDAIDAEIGREYSPEKSEQYKQRLLDLTRKLRQC